LLAFILSPHCGVTEIDAISVTITEPTSNYLFILANFLFSFSTARILQINILGSRLATEPNGSLSARLISENK
jgi:hypothetical protein